MRNKTRPVELSDEEVDQVIGWLLELKQAGQHVSGMAKSNVRAIRRGVQRPGRESYQKIYNAYNLFLEVPHAMGDSAKPN